MLTQIELRGQETVFALLKNDVQRADEYFKTKRYRSALELYSGLAQKNGGEKSTQLKLARCHYLLKQYREAVESYETVAGKLQPADLFFYAEALTASQKYEKAIAVYREYLTQVPDNEIIIRKIWRLNNLQFLMEDSLHFAVRPVHLNTASGELCPVPYKNGVVFMSDRGEVQPIHNIDAMLNKPFYKLYFAAIVADTAHTGNLNFSKPMSFSKDLIAKYHAGPVVFYNNFQNMAFTSSDDETGRTGERTLKIFFAEQASEGWKIASNFPFNSNAYSVSDPAISDDGKILFFSANMPGGHGGRDLYRSEFVNGSWTKPINLGDHINTPYDEVFPYYHQNKTLYFSSNGHAGIGGLDIFKAEINEGGFEEVQNVGYPINSSQDEFGIRIDSINTHGYFSSNRKGAGYNDDIYEFDMDLQTYPLTITGIMKYKEDAWADSTELKPLSYGRLFLIDNLRNVIVHEGTTDGDGNFSIDIPYFTKYRIRIIGNANDEHIVSLEIPKHRKSETVHEIVIVKDIFQSTENLISK